MINGEVSDHHIPEPSPSKDYTRDTQEDRNQRNSSSTKPSSKNYYEANGKGHDDDLELLPIINHTETPDWTAGPKGFGFTLLYFWVATATLIFFMNFVHQRMPLNAPPLPDLGHELLPKMEPETLGDMTMMIMIVLTLVAMILHKERWPILIRFFLTLGNMYFLRVVSISSTSMPPTENHCRFNFPKIDNIWINTLKGLVTLGSSNIHCGDLMFSGHTVMITNVWMTIQLNYKKYYILRIVMTLLLIVTMLFIIATRSHYSVDVWIAFWLCALVHKCTPRRFPFTKERVRKFFKHL